MIVHGEKRRVRLADVAEEPRDAAAVVLVALRMHLDEDLLRAHVREPRHQGVVLASLAVNLENRDGLAVIRPPRERRRPSA